MSGLGLERIAEEIGVSVPTLRKHYFQNGRVSRSRARRAALAEARAANLLQLQARADDGSVAALNAIRQIIEREALGALDEDASRPAARAAEKKTAPAPRPVPAGKKQVDDLAAREAERELGLLLDGGQVH